MSLLNWFTGKKSPPRNDKRAGSSGASASSDQSRSTSGARTNHAALHPAAASSAQRLEQRRSERNTKRELLFQVVRESMVRVGVLSTAFKFKVLSLDQRGRSFLVMIELSAEFSGEVEKLAEIESMIAQTAKHRYDLIVQAVYWRYFNAASSGASSAPAPLLGAQHAPISRPAPLFGMESHTAAPRSAAAESPLMGLAAATPTQIVQHSPANSLLQTPAPAPKAASHDELGDDEVEAFRRALAAGASQGALAAPAPAQSAMPANGAQKPTPPSTLENARNKLLLTGYEDTEMHDDDPLPVLSGTQYGELR